MLTLVVWVVFVVPSIAVVAPFGGAVDELSRGQVLPAAGLVLLGLALGFVLLPLLATPLIAIDRWRARIVDPTPLPVPPRAPAEPGAWLRDRYLTARRWRYAGYAAAALLFQTALLAASSLLGTSAGALIAAPVLASKRRPGHGRPVACQRTGARRCRSPCSVSSCSRSSPMPGPPARASRSACCAAPWRPTEPSGSPRS